MLLLLFFAKANSAYAVTGYYCSESDNSRGSYCTGTYSVCNCSDGYYDNYCTRYYDYIACVLQSCSGMSYRCNYSYTDNIYWSGGGLCAGSCNPCTIPSCSMGYATGKDYGCGSEVKSCTRKYSYCTSLTCGTSSNTCYKLKPSVDIVTPGGTCTADHDVCYGGASTAPGCTRSGYNLTGYTLSSGSCTSFNTSTGVCPSVTTNIQITANWLLANSAPTAPTSLLTEGYTNPNGIVDTTPEFSAIYNDPDSGDIANYYEIEVNSNSAFTGTVMWDTGKTSMTNLTAGNPVPDKSYAGTALSLNGSTYYWRIRFWDDSGAQGAWSATANFTMNAAPTAPTSLLTEGATNPIGVTDTTPEFSAIFNDPNTGQTGNWYQIEVNTNSAFTGTVMWNSGQVAMTATAIGARSPDISYAGTALSLNGTTYYWRIRFWDYTNTQGAVSSYATFTMNTAPTAPTSLLTEGATNPTGVVDLTPEFSAIFNDPNTGQTGNWYQIEVNTNSAFTGTVMWNSGLVAMTPTAIGARSPDISYAGTALSLNGTTYYWRIRFADNVGTTGTVSSYATFTMNTAPTAPTSLLTEGATNPTEVSDLTPEFSAIFNDPNTGQTGNWYRVEVNTNSSFSGTVMWDSGLVAMTATAIGARSPDISYNGTTLSFNGTTYYWRIRFADNVGTTGTVSATAQFTMNNSPYVTDLTTETYSNPIKIYDTTPEFSARFNDADAGSTGIYYQINVNTSSAFNGTSMWDSTKLSMTAVPSGSLITDKSYAGTALTLNGAQYFWRIKLWDDNNIESPWSSTANFRMSGPPDTPTALLTDGQTNPLYLNSVTPTFSAIYSDINSDNSSAYEIEVNTNNLFSGTVMWDTGKLSTTISSGNRSSDFTYAGTALTGVSNITYYWRMRFWDIDDNVSSWSATNTFRDSLMHLYLNGLKLNGITLN